MNSPPELEIHAWVIPVRSAKAIAAPTVAGPSLVLARPPVRPFGSVPLSFADAPPALDFAVDDTVWSESALMVRLCAEAEPPSDAFVVPSTVAAETPAPRVSEVPSPTAVELEVFEALTLRSPAAVIELDPPTAVTALLETTTVAPSAFVESLAFAPPLAVALALTVDELATLTLPEPVIVESWMETVAVEVGRTTERCELVSVGLEEALAEMSMSPALMVAPVIVTAAVAVTAPNESSVLSSSDAASVSDPEPRSMSTPELTVIASAVMVRFAPGMSRSSVTFTVS